MSPLRERIEYGLVVTLLSVLRVLPERLIRAIFRIFGALFFVFSFHRRSLALRNLKLVFPEKSFRARFRIAWMSFQNMSIFMSESVLITTGRMTAERILARIDDSEGFKKYQYIREHSPGGVINLTGHLGNWELLAAYGAVRNFDSVVITRKSDNRLIDERILMPIRTRFGHRIVHKRNAMLSLAKELKRGGNVSILIDQKINEKEGAVVKLLGQDVLAVMSAAALQLRFKSAAVPSFLIKTEKNKYQWLVLDPVEWTDDGTSKEEQTQKLTQRYQNEIEKIIRAYPEQWFWMHNRFKLMTAQRARKHKRKARREKMVHSS